MPSDTEVVSMLRRTQTFEVSAGLEARLRAWAAQYDHAVVLESHGQPNGQWDMLIAAGVAQQVVANAGTAFDQLALLQQRIGPDWLFGYFGYDLKNEVEPRLSSTNPDGLGWPDLWFFQPMTVIALKGAHVHIHCVEEDPIKVFAQIEAIVLNTTVTMLPKVCLQDRISTSEYIKNVARIKEHIAAGDVYELNYCVEYFADNVEITPSQPPPTGEDFFRSSIGVMALYERLALRAQAPMGAYVRMDDRYLLCASPERFLRKQGELLVSQPIKGTRKRGTTPEEDVAIITDLIQSEKDRAEHVMIVDLVRHDLAQHCVSGSVVVDDLFGIHTFRSVHQMITTVQGRLRPDTTALQALKAAFPMGSMTGAPKIMAMKLSEQYEATRRGLYSGAVGYFDPKGDFDFNVVIRSIQYNQSKRYVSCMVGGAIVYDSDPEEEFAECQTKLAVMQSALADDLPNGG
jgi:para-aminobenzoate synthetase component I